MNKIYKVFFLLSLTSFGTTQHLLGQTQQAATSPAPIQDEAKILETTKGKIDLWLYQENQVSLWRTTDLSQRPDESTQRRYVIQQMTKYSEKRIKNYLRSEAQQSGYKTTLGATLNKGVNGTNSRLLNRPQFFDLGFSTKLLQGKVAMTMKTPIFYGQMELRANGQRRLNLERSFDAISLKASLNYLQNNGLYVARLDQSLTQDLTASLIHAEGAQNIGADNAISITYQTAF